ncbi:MAG: single-stranded DNA-binding protein [Bacteroidaceae bacterium]|nr:single-stranded DNA-binding protein [Bacteroidaceae bacterium]
MSLNKVMLIGNVGQEPTVRYLDTGVCVASVRLATTDRAFTMRDGTQVPERAEWHSLIFWDKLAETVEKYVHKGDKLYVEGKIQSRNYTDKQGISRQVIEIMVNNMEMLTPKSSANPAGPSNPTNVSPAASPQPSMRVSESDEPPF